ncbi:MAG: hypothetical protein OEL20_05025 [Sulfuritalea sp.]|nr:hypothetical protein [Sulfuritalea sp.]
MGSAFARNTRRQDLLMVVDLDERGSFCAHVENTNGKTVFQFSNEDEETGWPSEEGLWLVEDGFMKHARDIDGLHDYLKSIGIAQPSSTLRIGG